MCLRGRKRPRDLLLRLMGHFTLVCLRAHLRKSWAEPEPSLGWAFSVNKVQQCRLGISDPSCRMFTLVARLGLGLEYKRSPEPSQCEKPQYQCCYALVHHHLPIWPHWPCMEIMPYGPFLHGAFLSLILLLVLIISKSIFPKDLSQIWGYFVESYKKSIFQSIIFFSSLKNPDLY